MKKTIIIVVGVLCFLLVAICVIANILLETAVHPKENKTRNVEACYQYAYDKYPEMKVWRDSLEAHGLWRDTIVVAADGLKRHAVILEHDSVPTGSTVVVHGYTDNAGVMMRYFYLHYEKLGRNVLVPELFAHGESEGDHIRFGWLDRLDCANLWLPLAHELWPDLNLVQHGLSMGAATTMFTSGEDIPDSLNVTAFIEDCGYDSTWGELKHNLKSMGLPAFPILHVASILSKIKYGWSIKESDSAPQLAKCTKPMLFIHGDADDFVPTEMVYKNYDAKISGYKEMLIVPGAAHAQSIHNAWDEYVQKVESFLAKVEQ